MSAGEREGRGGWNTSEITFLIYPLPQNNLSSGVAAFSSRAHSKGPHTKLAVLPVRGITLHCTEM